MTLVFAKFMKLKDINLIIDFDSTLVKLEGLEVLAELTMEGREDTKQILAEIKNTTDKGMSGIISFQESLRKRLNLFKPNMGHIDRLVELLKQNITDSVLCNRKFFSVNSKNIYVISGGFEEWILPITRELGLLDKNVMANKFLFDSDDNVIGFNESNPLTQAKGKAISVKFLGLNGEIIIIGDGYTDFEIKAENHADKFVYFAENVLRDDIAKLADMLCQDFDEVIEYIMDSDNLSLSVLPSLKS